MKVSHTCLSTPTASIPSYMIVTQPSLVENTNNVNSAWGEGTGTNVIVRLSDRVD